MHIGGLIRSLMRHPHDSMCTTSLSRVDDAKYVRVRRLYNDLRKRMNVLWVIEIQCKPGDGTRWKKEYPHFFTSEEDAWDYLSVSPDPLLRPKGKVSWNIKKISFKHISSIPTLDPLKDRERYEQPQRKKRPRR